jgi:hypothetical protein
MSAIEIRNFALPTEWYIVEVAYKTGRTLQIVRFFFPSRGGLHVSKMSMRASCIPS